MQGDECRGLFVVISGRIRTFSRRKPGQRPLDSSGSDDSSSDEEDEDHCVNEATDVHRVDVGRCGAGPVTGPLCSRRTCGGGGWLKVGVAGHDTASLFPR